MHGRPRVKDKNLDPERVRAAEQKAALFGQLLDKVLSACAAKSYDSQSLALSAKLLELNPEVYTIWNFRRQALAPTIDAGGASAVEAVAGELKLTEAALMKNPKSYATWHHRRWAVASGACSLEAELALVERLLDADDRNFHGWGYRQFIARRMGMPVVRELSYTRAKIEQNFSNYSAWHYRTALLPRMYGDDTDSDGGEGEPTGEGVSSTAGAGKELPAAAAVGGAPTSASAAVPAEVLDEEFELVKQAFYTEPEDQSGWMYHRWLLGCAMSRREAAAGGPDAEAATAALAATLETQAAMCEELLEVEPDAKWPLLTLTRLRQVQAQLSGSDDASAAAEAYGRLAEMDPLRRGFYADAAEGKAHVVAAPSRD